ncbi:MAG: hypothetical protein JO056_10040 [Alphaproteobacteria bacterium]|nr:hypothetical protein [Alphaproteobacteria bacterium]
MIPRDAARETNQAISGRPGWLIPLIVLGVTVLLSGLVLVYYLAPRPTALIQGRASPTQATDPIQVSLDDLHFRIPANYIRQRGARRGGALREVPLFAAIPDFRGYSDAEAATFLGNAADSPIIYILLHEEQTKLSETDRLRRIYLGYVKDARGQQSPFGLRQYIFKDNSGYRGEDLFVGRFGTGLVALRCERLTADLISPNCLRDTRLAGHVYLSYRFKRSQLARWREISSGVEMLVHSFMRKT